MVLSCDVPSDPLTPEDIERQFRGLAALPASNVARPGSRVPLPRWFWLALGRVAVGFVLAVLAVAAVLWAIATYSGGASWPIG